MSTQRKKTPSRARKSSPTKGSTPRRKTPKKKKSGTARKTASVRTKASTTTTKKAGRGTTKKAAKTAPKKTSKKTSKKAIRKVSKKIKRKVTKRKVAKKTPSIPDEMTGATLQTAGDTTHVQIRPRRPSMTSRRAETLLNLEDALRDRIVGKSMAIEKIARVIRVRLAQLDFRPERPDGSFLLTGPSGVGKNEFAYALSEVLFGTEERVVSIDLGEIADEEDIAKLGVTAIPGTDNHYLEGMLTSPVREDPEAIVLLRGLENAHPAFQRLLLYILERGRLDDQLGTVDFSKTIIIVTGCFTAEDTPTHEIGFGRPTKTAEDQRREHLERFVMADLLDAFNEVVDLPPLTAPEVRQIARYKVGKVLRRMETRKKAIHVADSVYEELITEDLLHAGGAKFLNRTLEEQLFNPLARYILTHRGSQQIDVRIDHGQIVIQRSSD